MEKRRGEIGKTRETYFYAVLLLFRKNDFKKLSAAPILKLTLTFFVTDVPNLELLPIGGIPGTSSNSIMPFHNGVPKLVR